MSQFNKQTMQDQHTQASQHHKEASKHHQDAANYHKADKPLEGFASANKAQGHAHEAGRCAAEASRHSAGITSSQETDQYDRPDSGQQKKDNEGYRPQR